MGKHKHKTKHELSSPGPSGVQQQGSSTVTGNTKCARWKSQMSRMISRLRLHLLRRFSKRSLTKEGKVYTDKDMVENLEKVLHHVGDMGRYQVILFFCMLPAGMCLSFLLFVQMFIAATPKSHWCKVPELSHLDMELRRNLSAPGAASGDDFDKCSTYDTDWTRVLQTMKPPDPDTPTIPCQHGWDFDLSDIPYQTVVSERGWVCQYARNVPIAQSMFFVGCLFGGFYFGWMADNFGRLPAFIAANILAYVGSIATIFTSAFWDFSFCRFVVGLSYDSNFMLIYIVLMEYVGPEHRTWVANMSTCLFFGGSCIALPWLALWMADWRRLLWLTSLPMLMVVFAPWVVPESARWLAHHGKVNRAVKVLKKFERINGTNIPKDLLDEFILSCRKTERSDETIAMLLQNRLLRIAMLNMMFVYMSSALIFDGLVRMTENLGSDFFITFSLTSTMEIPSIMLLALVLDIWGRRNLTAVSLVASGTLIMIAMFVSKGILKTGVVIMAQFFINMAYTAVIQWCTELLPTGMRAFGSSIMHVSGFFAEMFSPFIIFFERLWVYLPMLTLGIVGLIAGSATTALPETRGCAMPQTIADSEHIVREHSLLMKPQPDDQEVSQRKTKKKKALIS